jgi:hypothetical protein
MSFFLFAFYGIQDKENSVAKQKVKEFLCLKFDGLSVGNAFNHCWILKRYGVLRV